jgi:CheY-like chemotaxis protein
MNLLSETDKPASVVRLIVRDTGCGMDEATKAQVFEPFFTTKKPGKGTGLGLATVHGIITKSDGTIQVQSTPGQGSTFIIEFPRHEVQPHAEREVRRPQTPAGTETILLVEDAATVRQLLREVLRSAGYYLLEASDGVEALEQSRQHQGPIHLMITDAVMPRMGGRQLMDEIRLTRPDIQFLLMSGYMSERAGRLGSVQIDVPFIQKPFLPSDLLRTVRQVLDRSGESKPALKRP